MSVLQVGGGAVTYGCDGCEAWTGDAYARVGWDDDGTIDGWTLGDDGHFCPDCALIRATLNLRDHVSNLLGRSRDERWSRHLYVVLQELDGMVAEVGRSK